MNWSRYSNVAVALLVLVSVAAVPVAAVSVSADNAPNAVQVGATQDVTFTFTDLYTNYDQWTLKGHTDLKQVTWTVTTYDLGGAQLRQVQYNAQNFSHPISKSEDVAKVTVRLQGTTPQWSDWSYKPPQNLTLARFAEVQQGGASSVLETYSARPYTTASQQARNAISQAQAAIDEARAAGANTEEASSLIDNAISAYNNGNFQNAENLANQAQNKAQASMQSTQRRSMLLYAGAGIVGLLVVIGLVYWYLQQRDTYDKLG
ncbi:MAG: hypothetical protein ABEJ58_00545 [Halodesulfurarchaeum sp.]